MSQPWDPDLWWWPGDMPFPITPTPRPVATHWVNGPTLDGLKDDAGVVDTRDDLKLQIVLDAAIAFVLRRRKDLNFENDVTWDAPLPGPDTVLGTYRLAYRWHVRRRSPDALIQMGDLGASKVPSFDADIERLLGIGRYSGPTFA